MGDSPEELATRLKGADRTALARAITLAESTHPDDQMDLADLLNLTLKDTGNAIRIGISGAPGAGKSTFIEALGLHLVTTGHRVAVLAVDPSSSRSGGSILGDKTRMGELATYPGVFIRPSPNSGHLGGVTMRTREAILLCEAAGFDVVVVETVGVGQSEIEVSSMVDIFLLIVAPGGGDELQGIKRGVMELADIVVVNKADGDLLPAATLAAAENASALRLMRPNSEFWTPKVFTCSSLERSGIEEIWSAIQEFQEVTTACGELEASRSVQAMEWMWNSVKIGLNLELSTNPAVEKMRVWMEPRVAAGEVVPSEAARQILEAFKEG